MLDILPLENIVVVPSHMIFILISSDGIPAAQFKIAEQWVHDSK